MRIEALVVKNFRAITSLELSNLGDTVVVAGPNGCGKSCVFDAIRLLKSIYGGYQPNEWQNWFGEFQININQTHSSWLALFQNKSQPLKIEAQFRLAAAEVEFLRQNGRTLLASQIWKEVAPEVASWRYYDSTAFATNLRVHEPEVKRRVDEAFPKLESDLRNAVHRGQLTISTEGEASASAAPLLELIFSQYDPQHIGIIDYHGANRNYGREQVGGINLNVESTEDRLRQHALYNNASKYQNLKTEMAATFVRSLLAQSAGSSDERDSSLSETLEELFATFFPGKKFLGPIPTSDGRLTFPVRTAAGSEHDIDELSSGEKEVLYGYLRLRNTAPRNSVLLIDEPELHLNPRLISGLVSFYHRYLGRALNNQLWLVSHSDTLIREAVGQPGFSVYHLQPPGTATVDNQATPVVANPDLERLVIELVGDLAAYRPGALIVIFEGGGDSEFDVRMTEALFPEFMTKVNAISGGSKGRVADLYEVLEQARQRGIVPAKFFAITDSDGEFESSEHGPTRFSWDVYHIENYLLEPEYVLRALQDIDPLRRDQWTATQVLQQLEECARETVPSLVARKLQSHANRKLIRCVDLSFDPQRDDVASALSDAIERSNNRIRRQLEADLSRRELARFGDQIRADAARQLSDGTWKSYFRGRDVLGRFSNRHGQGISYETFRNLIIARMKDDVFEPPGMKKVVQDILSAV